MKKTIIFLFVALLFTFSAQAQIVSVTSASKIPSGPKEVKKIAYLSGNLGVSTGLNPCASIAVGTRHYSRHYLVYGAEVSAMVLKDDYETGYICVYTEPYLGFPIGSKVLPHVGIPVGWAIDSYGFMAGLSIGCSYDFSEHFGVDIKAGAMGDREDGHMHLTLGLLYKF